MIQDRDDGRNDTENLGDPQPSGSGPFAKEARPVPVFDASLLSHLAVARVSEGQDVQSNHLVDNFLLSRGYVQEEIEPMGAHARANLAIQEITVGFGEFLQNRHALIEADFRQLGFEPKFDFQSPFVEDKLAPSHIDWRVLDTLWTGPFEGEAEADFSTRVENLLTGLEFAHVRASGIEAIDRMLVHKKLPRLEHLAAMSAQELIAGYEIYEVLSSVPEDIYQRIVKNNMLTAFLRETHTQIGGDSEDIQAYADRVRPVLIRAEGICQREASEANFEQMTEIGAHIKSVGLGPDADPGMDDAFHNFYMAGKISGEKFQSDLNKTHPKKEEVPVKGEAADDEKNGGLFGRVKRIRLKRPFGGGVRPDRSGKTKDESNGVSLGVERRGYVERYIKWAIPGTILAAAAGIGLYAAANCASGGDGGSNGEGQGVSREGTPDYTMTISPTPAVDVAGGFEGSVPLPTATSTDQTVQAGAQAAQDAANYQRTVEATSAAQARVNQNSSSGTKVETAKTTGQVSQGVEVFLVDRADNFVNDGAKFEIKGGFEKDLASFLVKLGVSDKSDVERYTRFLKFGLTARGTDIAGLKAGDEVVLKDHEISVLAYILRVNDLVLPQADLDNLATWQVPIDNSSKLKLPENEITLPASGSGGYLGEQTGTIKAPDTGDGTAHDGVDLSPTPSSDDEVPSNEGTPEPENPPEATPPTEPAPNETPGTEVPPVKTPTVQVTATIPATQTAVLPSATATSTAVPPTATSTRERSVPPTASPTKPVASPTPKPQKPQPTPTETKPAPPVPQLPSAGMGEGITSDSSIAKKAGAASTLGALGISAFAAAALVEERKKRKNRESVAFASGGPVQVDTSAGDAVVATLRRSSSDSEESAYLKSK